MPTSGVSFGVLPVLTSGGTVQTPLITYSGGMNNIECSIDGLTASDLTNPSNDIDLSFVISAGAITYTGAGFTWQGASGQVAPPVLSTGLVNMASGSQFFVRAIASGNFSLGISGLMT